MTDKLEGSYLQCRLCELGDDQPSDFEVICDGPQIQIWCMRHEREVGRFNLAWPLWGGPTPTKSTPTGD